MRSATWMGWGLSGVVLLGIAAPAAGAEGKTGQEPALEIRSLDPGDCTLGLSWPWGGMAVNRVMFNDHRGPFKAVVESSGRGVRVTFDGWGREPFVASADKIRIIYRVAGRKDVDLAAEAISGGPFASDGSMGRRPGGDGSSSGLARVPPRALRKDRSKAGGIEPGRATGRSVQARISVANAQGRWWK